MKALALVACVVVLPASAETLTYPRCIDLLQSVLQAQSALHNAFDIQHSDLAVSGKDAFAKAPVVNVQSQRAVAVAFDAYVAAVADACNALR